MRVLARSVMLSMMLVGAACAPKISGTATENELCRAWGATLFFPSRQDTGLTAEGLTAQIRDFRAACPGYPAPPQSHPVSARAL